jgi:hypothetical protein
MLRDNILVFDEYVTSTFALTKASLNGRLGTFDQFALMCVIEHLTGSNGFDLWAAHSADARLWLYRQATPETVNRPATGDIHLTAANLATHAPYYAFYYDPGALPLLSFVRFEMAFGSATAANVKVYVTQRDQGG